METYSFAPGNYTVGLCDVGLGSGSIDNGDWAQGWAMVITSP
jgi:hypothetical protein